MRPIPGEPVAEDLILGVGRRRKIADSLTMAKQNKGGQARDPRSFLYDHTGDVALQARAIFKQTLNIGTFAVDCFHPSAPRIGCR